MSRRNGRVNRPTAVAARAKDPQPVEVKIPKEAVEKLLQLETQAATMTALRDTYQQGLCAGLGVDPAKVMKLDVERGVLVMMPDLAATSDEPTVGPAPASEEARATDG